MTKKDKPTQAGKPDADKPKIVADDDWKAQAAAEKEKLAEQIEGQAGQAGEAAAPAEEPASQEPRELPEASLAALINQIAMQVMMALGGYEDPKTKKRIVDLALARFHVDTLKVIEDKTAGNRTEDESKMLDKVLYETRMQYVRLVQQVGGS